MLVETIGKPANVSLNMVRSAANFYGDYLLGTKLSKNVNLSIKFIKYPRGSYDYAECIWKYENHCSRDFEISIDRSLCRREMLLALAHEMVHLKQYAKGELKDYVKPARMIGWMGEKFLEEELDYWEQPWEIEAYGREKGLYFKFMNHWRGYEV